MPHRLDHVCACLLEILVQGAAALFPRTPCEEVTEQETGHFARLTGDSGTVLDRSAEGVDQLGNACALR